MDEPDQFRRRADLVAVALFAIGDIVAIVVLAGHPSRRHHNAAVIWLAVSLAQFARYAYLRRRRRPIGR